MALLTSVDIDSENSFSLPIAGSAPKDSIICRSITGLNPPDPNVFIGDFSSDGGSYQGRRVGVRNPVMTMELNPNPGLGETVESLRNDLYRAFMDPLVEADYVKVGLNFDDGRHLYMVGYTEKFETEIFSVDTLAQISMLCPDPYLRDENATTLSHPSGWTTVPFKYKGTAETGFEAQIHINSATTKLILANNTVTDDPSDPLYVRGRMILNRSFAAGDVVTINTVRGHRRLTVRASGGSVDVPIIGNLTPTSPFLQLHSQSNVMKVYGSTPSDLPASIRSLVFVQAYWGI